MTQASAGLTIATLIEAHWPSVAKIYGAGIATGNATFQTQVPAWSAWNADHLTEHRLVALQAEKVVGWTAVSAVSGRCVYAGVVENSVYVDPDAQGAGVGRRLLQALIDSTEAAGIWTIQTGIFPENTASLALHQAVGFRIVGTRERIGLMSGHWRDVIFLERRSPLVGF